MQIARPAAAQAMTARRVRSVAASPKKIANSVAPCHGWIQPANAAAAAATPISARADRRARRAGSIARSMASSETHISASVIAIGK